MISVGVNNTSKQINCNINNDFTPIKIGIDGKAVNVTKILIGNEEGKAKEVYFNQLYDFRHTFYHYDETGVQLILFYNDINDRNPSSTTSSDMTLYIINTQKDTNIPASLDVITFTPFSEDQKKIIEFLAYDNITKVIIDNGEYGILNGLMLFRHLEFLEIPSNVHIITMRNMFGGCSMLKTVNIHGTIDRCEYSFYELFDGSSILCFNTPTYNVVKESVNNYDASHGARFSVIYNCREDILYTVLYDGNICINNNTLEDNKIVADTFINNFYTRNDFDSILGQTTL